MGDADFTVSIMSANDIAESLTPQQRDAICGIYSWGSPIEEDEGEAVLYKLGLWRVKINHGESILTPLGKEVRAIVIKLGKA